MHVTHGCRLYTLDTARECVPSIDQCLHTFAYGIFATSDILMVSLTILLPEQLLHSQTASISAFISSPFA